MADNAFVKIGTALLKHQVKKLVGEETLGVIRKHPCRNPNKIKLTLVHISVISSQRRLAVGILGR